MSISVIPLIGIPEVKAGDNVGRLIVEAARDGIGMTTGDVVVVTQKIVSKAEGRIVVLADISEPSSEAQVLAAVTDKDPRLVELILQESLGIVRQRGPVLITETLHGFVCANAGIDSSNVGPEGTVCLLPEDPDRSAREIRDTIAEAGADVAVIISDTFGRPWREGHTNVAIGVAGMLPFVDYVGQTDSFGYELRVSTLCVADELAAAAELVQNKLDSVPVAIVRGFGYPRGEGSAQQIVRARESDLFR